MVGLYRTLGNFMGQRLSNIKNSKYVNIELAKYHVENIEELPLEMQIAIEREAAYLRGLSDGIRICNLQKNQCP